MEQAKQIELHLSIEEVNTVLEAMGQLPFVRVYTTIEKIQQQASQQLNGQAKAEKTATNQKDTQTN